jgi:phosphatidate phosphatase APP1
MSITTRDSYIRPHKGNLGIISDIDDTFLVSHTLNPLLYVLLFKTSIREKYTKMLLPLSSFKHSRKGKQREFNAFSMYLAEWNLYRFITKFTEIHKLQPFYY